MASNALQPSRQRRSRDLGLRSNSQDGFACEALNCVQIHALMAIIANGNPLQVLFRPAQGRCVRLVHASTCLRSISYFSYIEESNSGFLLYYPCGSMALCSLSQRLPFCDCEPGPKNAYDPIPTPSCTDGRPRAIGRVETKIRAEGSIVSLSVVRSIWCPSSPAPTSGFG